MTDASFAQQIGAAIRRARKARGWDQAALATEVTRLRRIQNPTSPEASVDTVSRIERGGNATTDMLEGIAAALGTTVFNLGFGAWSVQEKSTRWQSPQPPREDGSDVEVIPTATPYKKNSIPVLYEGEASPSGIAWDDHGVPLWTVEQWGSRPSDVSDPKAYIVIIRNDSMEPYYKRGWRAIVSPSRGVADGDLVCVHLSTGERLIKVAHREPEGWLLESYNPAYKPRLVRDDDVAMIHKVVYVRTFR